MDKLSNLLNYKTTRIILSIIWGIGLSTLFKRVCKERKCIIIKAPKLNLIKNKIFEFDNKCYIFKPKITTCNN